MERVNEKAKTEQSACSGPRQVRRARPQRGKAAGQQRKWPQGRFGEKPQEEDRRPAQRTTSAPRSPEKLIEIVIAAICARFGDCAIGRGSSGIRFVGGREFVDAGPGPFSNNRGPLAGTLRGHYSTNYLNFVALHLI
jgi:hypothetical protein